MGAIFPLKVDFKCKRGARPAFAHVVSVGYLPSLLKLYLVAFGLNIFYYFNFTIIIQANTYSTRLGIGTEAKCLLSSSP